ncbi:MULTISPECIES: antitoxin Xre/MbcA/ParS toxin-binding domain-containing protein [unclassified Mesorhizobium]|uniref:antitoxin Xre/MbcA/ParS-like domain-containing protein n=1 Tax=unclassified Mesorhizobium TaxID=325217 RepID=UPI0010922B3E|nr:MULTISPECIES: antitoxin Xre/MbcA/ParS toxin-binding domain-containing protein [unclassified Mesorhizobium]TGQ45443.1 DUF2384 domain-containing protein [Mesorhizobium sp. M4B.F.Ca.ET.214.01.1.1]TGQ63072.1 DUF2384 domain-containing protein [Mesorhizobium sp. M4B.F.Ca.ET.211.01.1.1]TGU40710.1 DUF2384 domain-containing protein [Mesorhizobium sp. M4B.F.Ca.ET.150.01.1.1]
MTRFQNPTDAISQDALAGLVAEAVQQALIQHGVVLDAQTLGSTSAFAGNVAASLPFLPQAQRLAIGSFKGEWSALASELVHAVTAAQRDMANTSDDIAALASAGDSRKPASPDPRERTNDLQSALIEDWAGEVAGSTYLEENFRIPRSTLHRWQRRNEVIALRKGGRKHVFPLAQFVDGRPAPGISEVLSLIANPRLAWFWLTRPSPDLGGRTPIEMLKHDMVREVVQAAREFTSADSLSGASV